MGGLGVMMMTVNWYHGFGKSSLISTLESCVDPWGVLTSILYLGIFGGHLSEAI